MSCEQYLINILNTDNITLINDMAEMYNAERLKEYCNWFYRKHCQAGIVGNITDDSSMRDE